MWRLIAVFLLGSVLGTGLGVALGFLAFPYVFPPPAAQEQLTDAERTQLVATGAFIHADPSDPSRAAFSGFSRRIEGTTSPLAPRA